MRGQNAEESLELFLLGSMHRPLPSFLSLNHGDTHFSYPSPRRYTAGNTAGISSYAVGELCWYAPPLHTARADLKVTQTYVHSCSHPFSPLRLPRFPDRTRRISTRLEFRAISYGIKCTRGATCDARKQRNIDIASPDAGSRGFRFGGRRARLFVA